MTQPLTLAYENGAFIPGGATYPTRWSVEAAAFREAHADRLFEMDYASHPRHKLDLFLPGEDGDEAKGLLVFIHGGYWKAFDKSLWSHLAAGALARGWAVAIPGYTLAPEARIGQMTGQVAMAIGSAAVQVKGPIVVTGHSAGGIFRRAWPARIRTTPGHRACGGWCRSRRWPI